MLLTLTDIQNSCDFMSAIGGIDTAVPARIDGHKTHHTETYIACRLLSTPAEAGRLTFPLSVNRRDPPNDRPDVVMRTGNSQVGIEITEAIPERFAALCALAEKEFPFVGCLSIYFRGRRELEQKRNARPVAQGCTIRERLNWRCAGKRMGLVHKRGGEN